MVHCACVCDCDCTGELDDILHGRSNIEEVVRNAEQLAAQQQ